MHMSLSKLRTRDANLRLRQSEHGRPKPRLAGCTAEGHRLRKGLLGENQWREDRPARVGQGDQTPRTRRRADGDAARPARPEHPRLAQHPRRGRQGRCAFKSLGDAWADTTTPHGRLMLTVLGGLAEFERELILARTGAGRVRAKAQGVRFGRPPSLTPHQRREAMERLAQGAAQAELARSYGVSQSTISRLAAPGPFEASAAGV